jgi:iron(III) transport system substrate-binding protein
LERRVRIGETTCRPQAGTEPRAAGSTAPRWDSRCRRLSPAPSGRRFPHKAIYCYQGADRDAKIAAQARKEGQVVVYTSLNLKDSVPITEAFEKKTGVKAQLWRASSEKGLQRAATEAARRAGFRCDISRPKRPRDGGPCSGAAARAFLQPAFQGPAGSRRSEATALHRDALPTLHDRVHHEPREPERCRSRSRSRRPTRWSARVGIEGSVVDCSAAMVKSLGLGKPPRGQIGNKGLDFFRKLAANKPWFALAHNLMGELLASGEFPCARRSTITMWSASP